MLNNPFVSMFLSCTEMGFGVSVQYTCSSPSLDLVNHSITSFTCHISFLVEQVPSLKYVFYANYYWPLSEFVKSIVFKSRPFSPLTQDWCPRCLVLKITAGSQQVLVELE